MCLMVLALGASQRWPLVIASNRDEFWQRPALPLAGWTTPDGTSVYSGRDLLAGGTWLGCTPAGRVAALTNVRSTSLEPAARSRGDLTLAWLTGRMDAASFLAATRAQDFGGCNLVLGDVQRGAWVWASNRNLSDTGQVLTEWHSRHLSPGIYGLSNAWLDTPWPKTLALKQAMAEAINAAEKAGDQASDKAAAEAVLHQQLWQALASRQRAPRHLLPQTGLAAEVEWGLSSAYVDMPERRYGTRCSAVLSLSTAAAGCLVPGQPSRHGLLATFSEKTSLFAQAAQTDPGHLVSHSGLTFEPTRLVWQLAPLDASSFDAMAAA